MLTTGRINCPVLCLIRPSCAGICLAAPSGGRFSRIDFSSLPTFRISDLISPVRRVATRFSPLLSAPAILVLFVVADFPLESAQEQASYTIRAHLLRHHAFPHQPPLRPPNPFRTT